MKFNNKKISHYLIFSISSINYFLAIFLRQIIKNKNENILLFGHKLTGNLEVIFNDERFDQFETFFITVNPQEYAKLKKIYGDRILTPLNFLHLMKALKSKVLITSHGLFLHNALKKLDIKTILCGHAIHGEIPVNKKSDKKKFQTYDEVWLHSSYDKKILTEERGCDSLNFKVFGFARNQKLIENIKNVNILKNNNSLNGKKIILYAPTGNRNNINYINSEFSISNISFYKFMDSALRNSDVILIIKKHLNDDTSKEIETLVHKSNSILFQKDLNLEYDYDSLIMSDLLITDLSTIYVDYLLLDKPIYIINNPDPDPGRIPSSILKNTGLPNLASKEEIRILIEKLKNDKLDLSSIKAIKKKVYGEQNHLETILKINETLSKAKT